MNGSVNPSVVGPLCNTSGLGTSAWLSSTSWPLQIIRGELNKDGVDKKAASGTLFDGFGSGITSTSTTAIFSQTSLTVSSTQLNKSFNVKTGNFPATMLQVLMAATVPSSNPLGVATVTSLLNAFSRPTTYPVSPGEIIAMFNAVSGGGTYMVGGVTPWNQDRVIQYLQSLYV